MFAGCSKDILKKYDKRIIGTWRITDVNNFGLGGNTDNLPFTNGTFTFNDGGSMTYINSANVTFQGHWDIVKKTIGDETVRSLKITVVDYTGQQALSENYDDMNFSGTDHFKANINSGFHTYVTHFRR
jgi:hypothetical protein